MTRQQGSVLMAHVLSATIRMMQDRRSTSKPRQSDFVYAAHGLQVMNRPAGTEWVDVQPGNDPTVFIDVFTQTIDERSGVPPDETHLLHLCYTTQAYRLLPNRRQRLGLRVEGGGASRLR